MRGLWCSASLVGPAACLQPCWRLTLLPSPLAPPRSAQPCEAHASLVVDALWGTGLPWAQLRALELFDQALG